MNIIKDKPIFITGCARSGTSMTAALIQKAGAFGGKLYPGQKENPKGMFENIAFRESLVKPYLRTIGADPMAQKPLPDIDRCWLMSNEGVENWRKIVMQEMRKQGYKGGPWYNKDPKMCLIWPVWYKAFPEATWIIVRRKSTDLINSCLKTRFMRAYNNETGWLYWIDQHKERFLEMEEAGLDINYVWPQEMIDRDYTGILAVVRRLGLKLDKESIEDFIEPALWSGK